jgi:hypothetical protein
MTQVYKSKEECIVCGKTECTYKVKTKKVKGTFCAEHLHKHVEEEPEKKAE